MCTQVRASHGASIRQRIVPFLPLNVHLGMWEVLGQCSPSSHNLREATGVIEVQVCQGHMVDAVWFNSHALRVH